jgi:hypothetical protein
METFEQIQTIVESMKVDVAKFYSGNKSAGTRVRKSAQDLKSLLQKLRTEILDARKTENDGKN